MVWVIGRIRSNWFGYQLGNRVNWFGLEQNWFGIGLDKSNLPHQCKPNANVWPSLPPDGEQMESKDICVPKYRGTFGILVPNNEGLL